MILRVLCTLAIFIELASMHYTDKSISHVNIYLPVTPCYSCRQSSLNLTAFGGCYTWKVTD